MRKVRNRLERSAQVMGLLNDRNLYWAWFEPKNFGDWVTPYLYEKRTGKEALHCKTRRLLPWASTLFGCGSILSKVEHADVAIVWGSGILDSAVTFQRPRRTLSVRGPRTRARMAELGYDCPDIYGDPGLLLPEVYRPKVEKEYELGLIPHFFELERFRQLALPEGWKLIDVTVDLEQVVDDIARCQRTVSSSLHGVIVSHAYGTPSAWIASDRALEGDGVKFMDYFESLGIAEEVIPGRWDTVMSRDLAALAFMSPDVSKAQGQVKSTCPFWDAR